MTDVRPTAPLLLLLLATCARPAPPPPAPRRPLPPPFPHAQVWTRQAGTAVRVDPARVVAIPYLFTRLEVLGSDSAALRVRCAVCTPQLEGWVEKRAVVYEARAPDLAAHGELPELLLAVRTAAARRDVAALRPVMSRQFTHTFGPGGEGVLAAMGRWEEEGYRTLDLLPFLLDRGVGTWDERVWAAPPAYLTDRRYAELRAGFRRAGSRWEWIFLVRGSMMTYHTYPKKIRNTRGTYGGGTPGATAHEREQDRGAGSAGVDGR